MGSRTAVILGNNFNDLEPVVPLCQLLCGLSAAEGSRYVDPNRNHLNTIRRHIGIYRSVIHTVLPVTFYGLPCARVSDVYHGSIRVMQMNC